MPPRERTMKHLWLRVGMVGLGALLGACGQDSNPTAPPGPSPSPSPTSAGFLHALQGQSIATYRIDGTTGQLQASVTQGMVDARTLTGDPQGRFVYAARSPGGSVGDQDPLPTGHVVVLAPDPKTGSLTAVSEASSQPGYHNQFHASGGWTWLSATSTRVYALWQISTSHIFSNYLAYSVGSDGQLGPERHLVFAWGSNAVVDPESGVFYWGDREYSDIPLRADTVEADGRLTQLGSSDLCGSSLLFSGLPLVAVNGSLLASGSTQVFGARTVCSYEAPQLTPRADLGLSGSATAAVAVVPRTVLPLATELASGGGPALVAMQFPAPTRNEPSEVRLFRMDADGSLHLLDIAKATGTLLFHPSGRFLYLAGPTGLKVFAIRAQSQLQLVQELPGSEGPMAVTLAF
jgi:hypothetical protein